MEPSKRKNLAPKELLYLAGRAHGLTSKEIAREHGVSYRTVEGAMRRVMYKLDARKITEAVFKATSEGLLCVLFFSAALTSATQFNPDQPMARVSRTRTTISLRVRTGKSGREFYV